MRLCLEAEVPEDVVLVWQEEELQSTEPELDEEDEYEDMT
jgi:hypothetical protein